MGEADPVIAAGAALPAGWTARPVRLPDDAPAIARIVAAYDARYRDNPLDPPGSIVDEVSLLPDAGRRDALLALDPDGVARGLAYLGVRHADADPPDVDTEVWIDPGAGAGTERLLAHGLLGAVLAHARAWAAHRGAAAVAASSGCAAADRALPEAFAAHGLEPVRVFYEMTVDHAAPTVPQPPAGVTVRRIGEADLALAHALVMESFADHWNFHARPYEAWIARRREQPAFDLTQFWVADLDGVPVGVCIGDRHRAANGGGYVTNIGVLRRARGRGVAKHLLRVAFAEHDRRGWGWTALHVDAANPTGATDLYRSVGMRVADRFDLYRRVLAAADAPGEAADAATTVAEPSTRDPS